MERRLVAIIMDRLRNGQNCLVELEQLREDLKRLDDADLAYIEDCLIILVKAVHRYPDLGWIRDAHDAVANYRSEVLRRSSS